MSSMSTVEKPYRSRVSSVVLKALRDGPMSSEQLARLVDPCFDGYSPERKTESRKAIVKAVQYLRKRYGVKIELSQPFYFLEEEEEEEEEETCEPKACY